MSFWSKLGVTINDLGCFKAACDSWNIEYDEKGVYKGLKMQGMDVHAILKDREGGSTAYLCKEGGGFRVVMDTDVNYSSIAKRCGSKLTRDYATEVVRKGATRSGAIINGVQEQPDGSVIMRISAVG
jgi:hypothetical protein